MQRQPRQPQQQVSSASPMRHGYPRRWTSIRLQRVERVRAGRFFIVKISFPFSFLYVKDPTMYLCPTFAGSWYEARFSGVAGGGCEPRSGCLRGPLNSSEHCRRPWRRQRRRRGRSSSKVFFYHRDLGGYYSRLSWVQIWHQTQWFLTDLIPVLKDASKFVHGLPIEGLSFFLQNPVFSSTGITIQYCDFS